MPVRQTIHIHVQASPKPALGAACNGCGVCCLVQPCPLGMLLSRRRSGACAALRWDTATRRYRCGALGVPLQPQQPTQTGLPGQIADAASAYLIAPGRPPRWWPLRTLLARVRQRLVWRWIGAGRGCDCGLEVESSAGMTDNVRC